MVHLRCGKIATSAPVFVSDEHKKTYLIKHIKAHLMDMERGGGILLMVAHATEIYKLIYDNFDFIFKTDLFGPKFQNVVYNKALCLVTEIDDGVKQGKIGGDDLCYKQAMFYIKNTITTGKVLNL